jgi:N-acyl-phosphatidylethanolamine-hydrolysing phospholipase D
LKDLPQLDAVVISHNHYDHLDVGTVKDIQKLWPDVVFFAPLGNRKWFLDLGIKNVIECDWWDEYELEIKRKNGDGEGSERTIKGRIVCTPCQHFTGRTIWDRNETLWSSWAVVAPKTPSEPVSNFKDKSSTSRFWFGGDTGYRAVPRDHPNTPEALDALPYCPAFKEIGETYGPFQLSAIPIGAYSPRHLMSPVHCDPSDAVRVHVDIKSQKSVGIHWGTWVLTDEKYHDPPERLKEEMVKMKEKLEKEGKKAEELGEFDVLEIGQTTLA